MKVNEPFLNEKGEICVRVCENDKIYTIKMDNPLRLNLKQAKFMMKILNGDIEDRKDD